MAAGKRIIRQLMGWICAALAAGLICNAGLFFYHRPAAWIDRQGGATDSILRPGSSLIHGIEGWGCHRADSRGYLNPSLPLASDYMLVVGSSYVQGKEVPAGSRFVDRMNQALAPEGEVLSVYSVSQDGFYFPSMVRCFPSLLAEFPDAGTIILEVNANAFTAEELKNGLSQQTPEPQRTGSALMAGADTGDKLRFAIKEFFPILTLGKMQLSAMISDSREGKPGGSDEAMGDAMKDAVGLLRSQYAGRLMIFYHPDVALRDDGTLAVVPDEKAALLADVCRDNGVEFVDASGAFLEAYKESYVVPCGFSNTVMASGHLNVDGHRICAEVLLDALEGGGSP